MTNTVIDPSTIVDTIMAETARKAEVWPCHTNRASEIGHDCERYLTYMRLAWEMKPAPSPDLLRLFKMGNVIEEQAKRDLADAGFKVYEQQRSFKIKGRNNEVLVTGSVDGCMDLGMPTTVPLEIKSISSWGFKKINSIEDMFNSDKPWVRKYPAQLLLYCFGKGSEQGVFYFVDKQSNAIKTIEIHLNDWLEYVEAILKKAERINQNVANEEYPERAKYAENLCGYCDFRHLCLPEQNFGPGVQILDDKSLTELLTRRAELAPAKSEYDSVARRLKSSLEGVNDALVAGFYITGEWVDRKEYTVNASKYWKSKYEKLPEA